MKAVQGIPEGRPALLPGEMRVLPFRKVGRYPFQGGQRGGMNALVREPGGQAIDRLDGRRALTAGGIDHMVGMGHLAFAAILVDPARHDPPRTNRELALEPSLIGAEESERQKPAAIEQLDAMGCFLRIGGLHRMNLAFDRCHGAGFEVGETVAHAPVDPAFRQMEQDIPDDITVDQAFQERLQLGADPR